MSKYAKASIRATNNIIKKHMEPPDAWQEAVRFVFPGQEPSQKKGCPKSAFLGLCEEGYIIGVKRGKYTRSKKTNNTRLMQWNTSAETKFCRFLLMNYG